MNPYTCVAVVIVVMLAMSALVGEWCGILAFLIALLMVFELDLHAEHDDEEDVT